jgi:hypothetical protein
MSSVCCSTPEAFAAKRSSWSLHPDSDRIGGLADGIGRRDRAVDQRREPADGCDPCERASERTDAGVQQLRLAADALQPARGTVARGLDALEALLAALADRDQLGLDLPAALHRQADCVRLRASGHGSACVFEIRCWKRARGERSRDQDASSGVILIADQ